MDDINKILQAMADLGQGIRTVSETLQLMDQGADRLLQTIQAVGTRVAELELRIERLEGSKYEN